MIVSWFFSSLLPLTQFFVDSYRRTIKNRVIGRDQSRIVPMENLKKNAITISERKLYLKDRYFHLFVHGFTEQSAAHDTAKSQL